MVCVLLLLATIGAYWPLCHCQFINFDDTDYVTENLFVQRGLTLNGLTWAFSTGHAGNWHPLTWISHMLDCQFFGLSPAGHHATNLFFHLINSLILFGLLKQMTGALWRSALVAALFGLHPIHVESVAWISERKDVLSAFFGLLAIWAYVRYVAKSKVQSLKSKASFPYVLSLLLFACSLMSKPMLVTLPFVLLLLDYWPLSRLSLPWQRAGTQPTLRLLFEKLPFFALSAAFCSITFVIQQKAGAVSGLIDLPMGARIANAAISYLRYAKKFLWPDDLAILYPPVAWGHWQVCGAALLMLLLSLLAVWCARQRPYLAVGWLWFAGSLIPVIGLVQVGVQSMADRYAYLPSIGFFIVVSWGLCDLARGRAWRMVLSGAGACVLLACAWLTALQVHYWQDSVSLFTRTLAVTGNNGLAHEKLGEALLQQRRFAEARAHLLSALQLVPQSPGAHYQFGLLLQSEGRPAEAIARWRIALQLKPHWPPLMNNLAWLLATCSDPACRNPAEAVRLAEPACAAEPQNPSFFDTLGAAYAATGRFTDAAAAAEKAIALAESFRQTAAAGRFRSRLELYRSGKAYPPRQPGTS
jgi:tetratricopeptide (TPR) repeat protein